jgi:predicted N-acyltransferase
MNWYNLCRSKKNELKPEFFKSVNQIHSVHWNTVLDNRNIYLSLEYLSALERSMQEQVSFRYIIFYNQAGKPVSIASVQILDFSNDAFKKSESFCKTADKIKTIFLETFDLKMMVCGNVFACGENGFIHTNDISSEEAYNNLSNGLYELRQLQKAEQPISIVLLKEFAPTSFIHSDTLKSAGFKDFKVDVNMVLQIHKDWKSMDDYLASMTTKFRTKAKGVFKKSKDITVRDLSEADIEVYVNEIEKLYQTVVVW